MNNEERILRLEQMVKTLNETISRIISVVNTGNYEYGLSDIDIELSSVKEFKYQSSEPIPTETVRGFNPNIRQDTVTCQGAWHKDKAVSMDQWCALCGRSS